MPLSLYRRLAWASGFAHTAAEEPLLSAEEVQAALAEGLGPLLGYRGCNGTPVAERTEDQALLRRQHLHAVVQEMLQGHALSEIGGLFAGQALPFLRLKAAALRGLVFPEGTRAACDLDLLVPPERFTDAVVLLRGAGFVLSGDGRRALTVARYHERNLHRGNVTVDLHRALSAWPLYPVTHGELLAEATPVPAAGFVPEPAHLLVTLATHAAQHGFLLPFRSIVDGLALVRTLRPDPRRVVETARRWRVARGTSMFLHFICLFGPRDDQWEEATKELAGPWSVDEVAKRLLAAMRSKPASALRHERLWRARLADDAWRTAAFYAYRAALLAGDVALRVFPSSACNRLQDIGHAPLLREPKIESLPRTNGVGGVENKEEHA